MGRGGGGCRGGGGSRSKGSHNSGPGVSAKSSSTKSSSSEEGEGSSKSSGWKPRVGGSGGHSSQTTQTTQSQVIHTLGPSSKECKKAFGELRSCLEANGDRMSVCQWYLSEWKKCQQKNLQTTK